MVTHRCFPVRREITLAELETKILFRRALDLAFEFLILKNVSPVRAARD